jgi:hypothetical protein
VKNYGSIAKPLTNLLHHKNFAWDAAIQAAFDQLKSAMTTTPVLAFPNFSKDFVVETNCIFQQRLECFKPEIVNL